MYTPFSDKLYYSAINYYPSTTNHTTYSYQYMLINIGVNVISGKKLTFTGSGEIPLPIPTPLYPTFNLLFTIHLLIWC